MIGSAQRDTEIVFSAAPKSENPENPENPLRGPERDERLPRPAAPG